MRKNFICILLFLHALAIYTQTNENGIDTHKDIKKEFFDAVENGNTNKVKEITEKGFDINTKDEKGYSALHIAVMKNNDKMLDTILNTDKVDVNSTIPANSMLTSKNGSTLRAGGAKAIHLAAFEGYIDSINKLLEHKANIDEHDSINFATPLHYAAYNGQAETAGYLLEQKLNNEEEGSLVNTLDNYGRTPIMYSAMNYGSPAMKVLLTHGANPNLYDYGGYSPLHYASLLNDYDGVKVLLDSGADPYLYNRYGYRPYDYASEPPLKELYNNYGYGE